MVVSLLQTSCALLTVPLKLAGTTAPSAIR
jgi:hypothetical protein